MKTKVFERGAICAAVAMLVVFSLPAYAKNGGSSGAQTRVSKTPSNTTSVKPVTSSRKMQSKTLQKSGEVGAIKGQLAPVQNQFKDTVQKMENKRQQEQTVKDNTQSQQKKSGNSGSIQKELDAQREMNKTINCIANC